METAIQDWLDYTGSYILQITAPCYG